MIKINKSQTAETLIDYGFTNYYAPSLYFCRTLEGRISFNLSVDRETLEIKSIDILDEDFCQPYDYQHFLSENPNHVFATTIYNKVNDRLDNLQEDGIITGFKVGMYI